MLRRKGPDGRYEAPQPQHPWSAKHLATLEVRAMDPRRMALPQVQGDRARVNTCPRVRAALRARWGHAPTLHTL